MSVFQALRTRAGVLGLKRRSFWIASLPLPIFTVTRIIFMRASDA
jgi:hypothetical protein